VEPYPELIFANFSYVSPQVNRRKCCQLSPTDDRRQFIKLSVHLGLQQYGSDAARRIGFACEAVTAETCSYSYAAVDKISTDIGSCFITSICCGFLVD